MRGTSLLHRRKLIKCSICDCLGKLHINGVTQQSGFFSVRCTVCDSQTEEFCFIYKAWRQWEEMNSEPKIKIRKTQYEPIW